jgi:vacuolar-type H+-ATPase subunit H
MKLNDLLKRLSTVGRFLATTLFCVSAVAFVWQGAFFSNTAAMANPTATLIAGADSGSQVQDNLNKGAKLSKDFIEDTKQRVERTASKNADKVEQATDDNGSVAERKANRDEARIYKRAEEDAARTKEQVDRSKNAVESAVDKIKDVFSN